MEEECIEAKSGYSIDICVTHRIGHDDSRKWWVEVDGPSHYVEVSHLHRFDYRASRLELGCTGISLCSRANRKSAGAAI